MRPRLRCTDGPMAGFGARLQAAERLIRLGARATVVADALAVTGPSRALVRRMYVGIRGPGRPRGPLPFDHVELVSTVAARMDASVFLVAWQRLRAAGADPGCALAGAWECLEAARRAAGRPDGRPASGTAHRSARARPDGETGGATARPARPLGIDQGWILALALEQGGLQHIACDHCGCSYFDACPRTSRPALPRAGGPADVPPRPAYLRCPHCAIGRQAARASDAGRIRTSPAASAARGTALAGTRLVAPATTARGSVRSHPLVDLACRYTWAEALFREGARPPIVTHVTGLAMTGTLRQLFIEVVGHGPRQGALPQLGEHIIATYARKLQSSVVAVTADRLVRAGHAPAPTLLETWKTYRSLFGASARFDINAVALVLRARHHPDFTLICCRACGCAYLELRLDIPGSRCPVCRQLRQAHAEAAWR